MKQKLIFFTGVYDTLDIFTFQLMEAFSQMGYEILQIDTNDMADGLRRLASFVRTPVKAAITFNNLAFNLELVPGRNIWEELAVPCINILMDHPFCYKSALDAAPSNAVVLCIDKKHMSYVQRFFPCIPIAGFLPHGGKALDQEPIAIQEREIDVMYAGGLARAFIQNVMPDLNQFAFPAKEIADQAYKKLIADNALTTEEVIEETLLQHGIRISDAELSYVISQLHYIELLAVSYYREKLIRTMVENGIRVHLFGQGWEICDFADHPNLVWEGRISSEEVLVKMHHSKIVLNTMTWFKDGTHDRVLNGMLAGAAVVTDESDFMKEEFFGYPQKKMERAELVLFKLKEIDQLPQIVKELLKHPSHMQKIADNGRRKALKAHTWKCRAKELQEDLLSDL